MQRPTYVRANTRADIDWVLIRGSPRKCCQNVSAHPTTPRYSLCPPARLVAALATTSAPIRARRAKPQRASLRRRRFRPQPTSAPPVVSRCASARAGGQGAQDDRAVQHRDATNELPGRRVRHLSRGWPRMPRRGRQSVGRSGRSVGRSVDRSGGRSGGRSGVRAVGRAIVRAGPIGRRGIVTDQGPEEGRQRQFVKKRLLSTNPPLTALPAKPSAGEQLYGSAPQPPPEEASSDGLLDNPTHRRNAETAMFAFSTKLCAINNCSSEAYSSHFGR